MTDKQTEALKLAQAALSASDDFLFNYHDCEPNNEREVDAYSEVRGNNMKAWEAIREALAAQPAQQRYTPEELLALIQCARLATDELLRLLEPLRKMAEQPAQQQEPVAVAWMWVVDGKPHNVTFGGANSNTPKDWTVLPLYTSPPASKPWVGLEPQDFDGVIKSDAFEAGAYWANNILREKNA